MEEHVEEHVPPPPEDPPEDPPPEQLAEQFQIVRCKCCDREWDLAKDEDRKRVLNVKMANGDENLFCSGHVPASSVDDVLTSLTDQRYRWEGEARSQMAKTEDLEFQIRTDKQISDAKLKRAFKKEQILLEKVKQLEAQIEKLKKENEEAFLARRKLTQALVTIRDKLAKALKKAMRIKNPLKGRMHDLLSRCCELFSKSKTTLHKQVVQGLRDVGFTGVFQPASLTETAHVHPMSLNCDMYGVESIAFCTVCRGLDPDGSDELEVHSPMLATIVLPPPAYKEDRAEALAALATPYDLQPIAWQTNGLALGN